MKWMLMKLIRLYQRISRHTPPQCRFYPTCSHYAFTAIERFGAVRGSYLAAARILRCHPWNPGGIDYVPAQFTWRPQHPRKD